jgi:hypothetical protein
VAGFLLLDRRARFAIARPDIRAAGSDGGMSGDERNGFAFRITAAAPLRSSRTL